VDAMRRALVLVKFEDMNLVYNHNNPWIISFDVNFLSALAFPIKNKQIGNLSNDFLFTHNLIKY
jgi:hypothetical protein